MGMSIDNAINAMYYRCYDSYTQQQAREKAIDTMRKYQKIEQIIRDWKEMGYDNGDRLFMLISGVLENGND